MLHKISLSFIFLVSFCVGPENSGHLEAFSPNYDMHITTPFIAWATAALIRK